MRPKLPKLRSSLARRSERAWPVDGGEHLHDKWERRTWSNDLITLKALGIMHLVLDVGETGLPLASTKQSLAVRSIGST